MPKRLTDQKMKSLGKLQNCRVVEIGIAEYAECVHKGPAPCSHALPFGYCFLCTHPRLDEIIENTKKAQQADRA